MEIDHPNGYKYVLFRNDGIRPSENNFYLASNYNEAEQFGNQIWPVSPVLYCHLLKTLKYHQDIKNFLRLFGNEWIAKNGLVYYKDANSSRYLLNGNVIA